MDAIFIDNLTDSDFSVLLDNYIEEIFEFYDDSEVCL